MDSVMQNFLYVSIELKPPTKMSLTTKNTVVFSNVFVIIFFWDILVRGL